MSEGRHGTRWGFRPPRHPGSCPYRALVDQRWSEILGLERSEVPDLLVVEGSWWRAQRERQRLPLLTEVRELGAPDWWWGRRRDARVVYACVYGAARTVEPVHVLGQLGCPAVVQIGSCGALQPGMCPGDVVLAERVRCEEGASAHYGAGTWVLPDAGLRDALDTAAVASGLSVWRGPTVTTEVLLHQPPPLVARWRGEGLLGVDMESAATLAAAAWIGMRAGALLYAWDDLAAGRSWTDPLPPALERRRVAAEAALFEVALSAALGA